ncbi:MAG TPA: ABC-2 family transporter protein, partial [Micromonosporaceae bacterium]
PALLQIVTADFQLRRLGRSVFALVLLVVVLVRLEVQLDLPHLYLLLVTPLAGAVIYGSLFVLAAGVQFWLIDGAEFSSSFVYGSAYAGQVPGGALRAPVRVLFTFVLPATLVAYAPALLLLGLPGPAWIPSFFGWAGPAVALLVASSATVVWSVGLRRYTSAGG